MTFARTRILLALVFCSAKLFAQGDGDVVYEDDHQRQSIVEQVSYLDNCCSATCCDCGNCSSYPAEGQSNDSGLLDQIRSRQANPLPWWAHRTSFWAEYLFLSPGDSDVTYATELSVGGLPMGGRGIVGIDASSGYRFGLSLGNTQTTSLVANYTHWQGNSEASFSRFGANLLTSSVIHPGTLTTGTNSLAATAQSSMSFTHIESFYYHKLFCTDTTIFNWSAGFRYGQFEQNFIANQDVAPATGVVTVGTDIDFNGFGLLVGLDAERRSNKTGMLCYSRGLSAFLGGEWNASFAQTDAVNGLTASDSFEDFRVTPILEAEIGIGWQNDAGNFRWTTGYTAQCWCNALTTRAYIDGVRSGTIGEADESIAFTGLTSRLELSF